MGNCKKCNNTGWLLTRTSEGGDIARKCTCREEDQVYIQAQHANIPERFLGNEIGFYFPESGNKSQANAKKIIEKFIGDFPAVGGKGLLFQGPVGVGKTHLLCCLAYELIKRKRTNVYYIDWTELVRKMRTGEDNTNRDFYAINKLLKKLETVELLLFDEIGASTVSRYVYDNIYYIINSRYNSGKMIVGATNFSDEDSSNNGSLSQRIGERLRSRLYEMTNTIGVQGVDFRKRNY